MSRLKVEVISPVHNRRELTLGCLRSLFSADLHDIDLHVIIVDDGSTDGTADALRQEFPDVEIVTGNGSLWYTGGINRGLEAAMKHEPDFILAINNDSEFDPYFLQHMLETARANPKSVVGAVLVSWEDRRSIFQVAPKWNVWWGGMRHWVRQTVDTLPKAPWQVELIVGNCVLFPAAVIREVGLMDEKKLPQYGDAEYTPRMRKAGWRLLIDPRALVYCKPNDVPERLSKMSGGTLIAKLANPHHPHSLKRRINATVGSSPNALQGYLAVAVFFVRAILGKNVEGRWAFEQDEPPLSELYKNATLDDNRPSSSLSHPNSIG
ncbi:MAG TPA: glycosyltransferase family 2 protein [Pyrinomonadaceae bacterium]|nr:glycosyltransferase family 2 protein [Pyrinomonadaceae bacterium]